MGDFRCSVVNIGLRLDLFVTEQLSVHICQVSAEYPGLMGTSNLLTFLLDDDFGPSSSALLFEPDFATALDFFVAVCSAAGCDEIRVERLGAGSSPSVRAALRGIAVRYMTMVV
jgi:hypothetical protein